MSELITAGQILSLKSAYREVVKKITDDEALYITKQFIPYFEGETLEELTIKEWKILRQVYPNWGKGDWRVGENAKLAIANAHEKYVEEVTGQMRMF